MAKLYIRAEFQYEDPDNCPGMKWTGIIKWLQADWSGGDELDRVKFAYSVAEEYLKTVLKVDFRVVHIIATAEGEF